MTTAEPLIFIDIISLTINWLGALLLTIEAMRISNFRRITGRLLHFSIAFNPPFYYQENGDVLIPQPAPGYKIFRKLNFVIEWIVGFLILYLLISIIGQRHYLFIALKHQIGIFFDAKWYFIMLKFWISLIIILIPGFAGTFITRLFTNFVNNYDSILGWLENNIKAGTIGFIGFILLTISFILNLIKAANS